MARLDDPLKRFPNWKKPAFDETGKTKWWWWCQNHEKLKLGKYVDIGAFTYINARFGVAMDELVQVGSHCSIYSASTIDNKKGRVHLERNARLGSHCVVMPGVTVGENSVIGAFSLVNKDVPPNVVAFGIPAKVVRKLRKGE